MIELDVTVSPAAAIQLAPVFGELDENRARAARAVEEAAAHGAALAVLPELCVSGYVFSDVDGGIL